MKIRPYEGFLVALLAAIVFAILAVAMPAQGAEVCPEAGKVEANSSNQDEVNNLILPADTVVCIKGSTKLTEVTADGESTLMELLDSRNKKGKLQDVSHYTIISVPETTTTTTEATTTTTEQVTTTTAPPTTVPPTTEPPPTTPPTSGPPSTQPPPSVTIPPELPLTGADVPSIIAAAIAFLLLGAGLVYIAKKENS